MRSTERFSARVADYIRYRPSYPPEAISRIAAEFGLKAGSRVADLGSGTGFLTELLLGLRCEVFGVEPNPEMRVAAEEWLAGCSRFHSLDAKAEDTGLEAASVDLVTAGQAFHWFDVAATRLECQRILRPGGGVALIWNNRRDHATRFLAGFERLLLRHEFEYSSVTHRRIGAAAMNEFFGPGNWRFHAVPNQQILDWEGLLGRVRSSSYAPLPGTSEYKALAEDLRNLFAANAEDGRVTFFYDTKVYWGRLS